jgi:hypothetical protein
MESKTFKYKHSPCFNYSLKDVTKFKKQIKKEFYAYIMCLEDNPKENKKIGDEKDQLYYFKYAQYMQQEFNSSTINMIISYINKNNSFPKIYKKEGNFNYKLCNLVKHLLMNEIEVACFTLLLEKIGFTYKNKDQWLYLSFIGILSKKTCGRYDDALLLIDIFSRNSSKFMEEYSIFLNDKDILSKLNVNKLNLKQINERFILLSKPVNTYCKKNYINIGGIIDQIIKTAQPYFKDKTFNAKHKININNDNKKFLLEKTKENNDEIDVFNDNKKLLDFNESFNYNEINFDEIRDLGYEKPYYIDDLDENNSSNMNWTISDLDDLNWLRFKDFQNN